MYCVNICEMNQRRLFPRMLIIALLNVETVHSHCQFILTVCMCYPGTMSDAKSYLFRSICQPTLLYRLDAVNDR